MKKNGFVFMYMHYFSLFVYSHVLFIIGPTFLNGSRNVTDILSDSLR